ncbi:MAG: NAD(P)-dependent oxidoreductase [Devosia sp.]
METIAVTGALGNVGRMIGARLEQSGYRVVKIDIVPSANPFHQPTRVVDLTRYGDVVANLQGCDGVVHFGSNPWPDDDFFTGADRYLNNTIASFNVFQAACQLGVKRVVYASSETVHGNPFIRAVPHRVPMLESDEPMPQTAYALSKLNTEQLALHMQRMYGTSFIGLRCSNILYDMPGHYAGYDQLPQLWKDPAIRRETMWKYVDSRDVAEIVLSSLKAELPSAEVFNVSAADTIMNLPTRELFATYFPTVDIAPELAPFGAPASIEKAARMLGWVPARSWRDVITA